MHVDALEASDSEFASRCRVLHESSTHKNALRRLSANAYLHLIRHACGQALPQSDTAHNPVHSVQNVLVDDVTSGRSPFPCFEVVRGASLPLEGSLSGACCAHISRTSYALSSSTCRIFVMMSGSAVRTEQAPPPRPRVWRIPASLKLSTYLQSPVLRAKAQSAAKGTQSGPTGQEVDAYIAGTLTRKDLARLRSSAIESEEGKPASTGECASDQTKLRETSSPHNLTTSTNGAVNASQVSDAEVSQRSLVNCWIRCTKPPTADRLPSHI